MAMIDLRYKDHWYFHVDDTKQVPEKPRLNPEIHRWLSEHKVRHTVIVSGASYQFIEGISILNSNQAMLFKLTWM